MLHRFLVALLAIFVMGFAEVKPRITAYPKMAMGGKAVRIEVFIPRHPDNRRMRMEMDGPMFRAFEKDIDGEDGPVLFTITIESLPEGRYVVGAVVLDKYGGLKQLPIVQFCRGGACIPDDIE